MNKKHIKKMLKIKQDQELILMKKRKGEEMPSHIKFAKPIDVDINGKPVYD